jgi:hypothetical protein
MNRKIITCVVLALVLTITCSGQKVAEELALIRNAYLGAPNISFEVDAFSYSTASDKTPELISHGSLKKSEGKYYSNFRDYEVLVDNSRAIMINNNKKSINIYEKGSQSLKPSEMLVDVDSLLRKTDSVVMMPTLNGTKHFICYSKKSLIQQTDIYVDADNHFISKILFTYAPSTKEYTLDINRVEVFYKNITTKAIPEESFSFGKFIKREKSSYVAVGKYQRYKINLYKS